MNEEMTVFKLVDKASNTWQCVSCGMLQPFEADGPYENGFNYCPHCGKRCK